MLRPTHLVGLRGQSQYRIDVNGDPLIACDLEWVVRVVVVVVPVIEVVERRASLLALSRD